MLEVFWTIDESKLDCYNNEKLLNHIAHVNSILFKIRALKINTKFKETNEI